MNFFQDRKIKKIAKKENVKAPSEYFKNINGVLSNLEDKKEETKINPMWKYALNTVMAISIISFIILPNISPNIAYAMEEIPIIGKIVKVVTIRNYFEKYGNSEIELEIPNIKNHNNSESDANNDINEDVERLSKKIMDDFMKNKNPKQYSSINVKTDVIRNTENLFTLKLTTTEVSASSDTKYKYYHIDKKEDKIVKLSDLFINDEYKTIFKDEIRKQMIERMKNDPNITYWLDNEKEEWSFLNISDNTNFNFSKNGNIIIIFDKYEVGPGSVGAPEFEIPKNLYEQYLRK